MPGVATFKGMPNANQKQKQKQQPGRDRGNAIANDNDVELDGEGRPLHPADAETGVTEEESKLAEAYPDGGAPGRRN